MRVFDVVKKLQDLTYLAWDEKAVTSGTGGTFLKSRQDTGRGPIYYKLSCYDRFRGIYGHESVNEVIASRLLARLDIPHVPYKLIHGIVKVNGIEYETWLSASRDYRARSERRQAFDTFYELNAPTGQSPLEFCANRGWSKRIFEMMAFDYLIANRDRHGANIEITYCDSGTEFAPLFDHGVSLFYSCYDDEDRIAKADPLYDYPAHNFLGTRSLEENLHLIPTALFPHELLNDDDEWLLAGLEDALPEIHLKKISEMIHLRWEHLVDLGIASDE